MKKIILIHRWEGTSQSDWYQWLKEELGSFGFEVLILEMPDTEVPVIESWVNYLSEIAQPDENTYFVGHSIGCQTILRYLETIDVKIGGVVFVAPWLKLDNLEDDEVLEIAKPWLETPINFEKIQTTTSNIQAILSSDEPYGYIQENKETLEKNLGAEVSILENRGHFTEDDNCRSFPEILSLVLENILHSEYPIVYKWKDEPNTEYPEHSHMGKVSFYVLNGSVRFTKGIEQTISKGQRIDVPISVKHTAVVGSKGRTYIVGQEIEGDA